MKKRNKSYQEINIKVLKLCFGIWEELHQKRKLQIILLTFIMLINALAEVLSIASVLPFLAAISAPEKLWQNQIFKNIAINLGYFSVEETLLPITIIFCLLIIFACFIRILNLRLNLKLAASIGTDLGCEAYKKILYQPFDFHIKQNTSEVIATIITETRETSWAIHLILQILTSTIICFSIILVGLIYNFQVTITLFLFLLITYLLVFFLTKKQLLINSKIISEKTRSQIQLLQEGLGSIRDILLDNNQLSFVSYYKPIDAELRKSQLRGMYLGAYPKFVLETVGLLLIALLAFILTSQQSNKLGAVPLLGAIALAAQRLLPICQTIYQSWAGLNNNSMAMYKVLSMIKKKIPIIYKLKSNNNFKFENSLIIKNLYFSYSNDNKYTLKKINLTIRKGEKIGIIGKTGSGKSTLADVLMGLLKPKKGTLMVDDFKVFDNDKVSNIIEWRKLVAHVPQNIFLADNNIQNNVALGLKPEQVNTNKVKDCLNYAQLEKFAKKEIHMKTYVGEKGVKLSGGESQRLGVARAMYKDAEVLFLDEATSALDNNTETKLMKAINNLKEMTIIIIAHRLSTISKCDKVIELHDGQIINIGKPEDFVNDIDLK